MPLWGTGQSGYNSNSALNFTDLRPGDDLLLLDGTETVATGSKSIPFARGTSANGSNTSSFYVTGCANGTQVTIQGSDGPVSPDYSLSDLDSSFIDLPGGALTGNANYTDVGTSAFYRAVITSFSVGDHPVVKVKR